MSFRSITTAGMFKVVAAGLVLATATGALVWRERAMLATLEARDLEQRELLLDLAEAKASTEKLRNEAREQIARLEAWARERVQASEAAMRGVLASDGSPEAEPISLKEVRSEIELLSGRIEELSANEQSEAERFQEIEEEAEPSIFLVHVEYSYLLRGPHGWERKTDTMWGTAFVASREGHLITNKHVVQPWKFDADLQTLVSRGQIRIPTQDVRITVWPAGATTQDDAGALDRATGFDSGTGALKVAGMAKDRFEYRTTTQGSPVSFQVHSLDDHDLAVLKLDESKVGLPLKPLRFARESAVKKLDRVLVVGYPRGQRGLDRGFVDASAALGTVRKAGSTIEVSAPMIAGNSGGPLLAEDGTVIGVATRIYTETLGICIRIDRALDLLEEVRSGAERSSYAGEPSPGRAGRNVRGTAE